MTFGQRLRIARKEKGFTQKELAATIKVKHNSVSNWEHDQNKPDLDTVKRICSALGIGHGFLLGDETETGKLPCEAVSSDEAKILNILRRLDEGERSEVLEFARFKLARKCDK